MFKIKRKSGGRRVSSKHGREFSDDERENLRIILSDMSELSQLIHERAEIALQALQQKSKGQIL